MNDEIKRLEEIIKTLRAPNGCPWDQKQTHESMLPGFLDEVYEFFEAVDEKSFDKMKEELGDILLQVLFHIQLAKEKNAFDLEDVAKEINDKLIRRHPHVFGNEKVNSTSEILEKWEEIKRTEKGNEKRKYVTDGIATALPSLFRAQKIQNRVSRVGFDWPTIAPALEKVEEEFLEFKEALAEDNTDNAEEELGDILFALVNVARHKNISAENALRRSNDKFIKRFKYIEDNLKANNKNIKDTSLEDLDTLWNESKKSIK